jgi:hypothetical protein
LTPDSPGSTRFYLQEILQTMKIQLIENPTECIFSCSAWQKSAIKTSKIEQAFRPYNAHYTTLPILDTDQAF